MVLLQCLQTVALSGAALVAVAIVGTFVREHAVRSHFKTGLRATLVSNGRLVMERLSEQVIV